MSTVSPHRQVGGFQLIVPGAPQGKQRARHGQGRTWTPRETLLAEQEIRRAWEEAGCPRVAGPVEVTVQLGVTRPRSHATSKGRLSAEGRRNPEPHRQKPDVDNALKLVMDALNTRAWADDVQVVDASVTRLWAREPFTLIDVRGHGEVAA
jgi:Holliday junction resolvase RusA-like endonuclease